jgi:hypothetical protein
MKFSMRWQEKGDLLLWDCWIDLTTCAGLIVLDFFLFCWKNHFFLPKRETIVINVQYSCSLSSFSPIRLLWRICLYRNRILVSIHLKMSMINKIFIVYQYRIGHRNVILHHFQQYFNRLFASFRLRF